MILHTRRVRKREEIEEAGREEAEREEAEREEAEHDPPHSARA